MEHFGHLGRMLVFTGFLLVAVGFAVMFLDRIPFLGKLPGDFSFRGGNWSVYFPLTTGLILSLIATILLNLFFRR